MVESQKISEIENKTKNKPNPINPTVTINPLFLTSGITEIIKEVTDAPTAPAAIKYPKPTESTPNSSLAIMGNIASTDQPKVSDVSTIKINTLTFLLESKFLIPSNKSIKYVFPY